MNFSYVNLSSGEKNTNIRKLLTLHPKSDSDRQYLPRRDGGRGFLHLPTSFNFKNAIDKSFIYLLLVVLLLLISVLLVFVCYYYNNYRLIFSRNRANYNHDGIDLIEQSFRRCENLIFSLIKQERNRAGRIFSLYSTN